MSTLATVKTLKESLCKQLAKEDKDEDDDVTTSICTDLLNRLDECDMTVEILTETLIGTVVSKFKTHETLGPTAKALIKKWKQIAKAGNKTSTPAVASGSAGTSGSESPRSKKKKAVASKSSTAAAAPPPQPSSDSSDIRKDVAQMERRESAASTGSAGNDDVEDDLGWKHLPEHRQNICQKLHSFLVLAKPALVKSGINATAVQHLTLQRALEIEAAIHEQQAKVGTKAYTDKARSLAFNLKKNLELCQQVILGEIPAQDLVSMTSEQLASSEVRKARAAEAHKLIESKRLDWEQANEDKINEMCGIRGELLKASLFTCSRCKSTKTTSTQKQTRSADEPMTVFVLCMNCGKRWKC